nr:hypothetical protein [Thermotalea metallivorans]
MHNSIREYFFNLYLLFGSVIGFAGVSAGAYLATAQKEKSIVEIAIGITYW